MNNTKIIIIGAGLSGLMIAYLLQKKGIDVLILEANTNWWTDRNGNRYNQQQWKWVPPGLVNRISILLPC
jgi:monoamine oxidase